MGIATNNYSAVFAYSQKKVYKFCKSFPVHLKEVPGYPHLIDLIGHKSSDIEIIGLNYADILIAKQYIGIAN